MQPAAAGGGGSARVQCSPWRGDAPGGAADDSARADEFLQPWSDDAPSVVRALCSRRSRYRPRLQHVVRPCHLRPSRSTP